MRHVTGLVLAVVMGAVLFGGAGWGAQRITSVHAHGGTLASEPGAVAVAALAGTGLLLGILLVAPAVSPLATVLPGLGLLAWSAYLMVNRGAAYRMIPLHASGVGTGFRELLGSGILALIGAVMVIPLFVPSRWRRRDRGDPGYDDDYESSPTSLLQ